MSKRKNKYFNSICTPFSYPDTPQSLYLRAFSQFRPLFKLAKFYLLCNVSLGFQFQNNSLSNCFACIRYAFIRLYCHFIVTTYTAPLKIHLLTIAFLFIIFPLYFNFHASKAPIICIPRYKFN